MLWELEWRTASVPEGSQSPQASALWQELSISVITVDYIFLFLQWPFLVFMFSANTGLLCCFVQDNKKIGRWQ